MKKNTPIINNNGFSLLEITIVLIIMSVLLSAVIPVLSRVYLEKAANKTALDIFAIEEASRKFYIDNQQWPDTSSPSSAITVLKNGAYLPPGWSATNPFVNYEPDLSDFNYYVKSINPSSLTVYTNVPSDAQPIIQNLLPTPTVDPTGQGHNVYSSIPVPGPSSSLPIGTILPFPAYNAQNPNLSPPGFLWCNGQPVSRTGVYAGLFAVIGTTYGNGDGSTTFNLPDMMGRTIVGVDTMGGANPASRIKQWGALPATMGGTFGEDSHRQTVLELAPHTHQLTVLTNLVSGSTAQSILPTAGVHSYTYTTSSTGGNGDPNYPGLGAPANVVQPSIALGYIIKY